MEYTLFTKLAAEFVGTAVLMVFGNGAVANAELKNTKGYHAGWLNIAMGYGFGVMFPVLMFGGVSGAHINPAMTLAQAVNGMFPWNEVLPYIIAQLLGAVAGQLIVYVTYLPHYKDTDDAEAILGTFCTTDAHNDRVNYFLNEFFGTFMLVLGAVLPVPAVGQGEPGRRIHRRRPSSCGPRDLHGAPDRPWSEPCPRPHAAPPARHPADSEQGRFPLGRGLDSGRGPDRRRYRRRVPVQGAVRLSVTLTIAGIRLACW